jgi:DnaJ-class molecular chaperone
MEPIRPEPEPEPQEEPKAAGGKSPLPVRGNCPACKGRGTYEVTTKGGWVDSVVCYRCGGTGRAGYRTK